MKTRVAFLVNLGTIVGWLFLVPLAVAMNFPIYDAIAQANIPIQEYSSNGRSEALQMLAFTKTIRTIAIGAIVGGGLFGSSEDVEDILEKYSLTFAVRSKEREVRNSWKERVGMNGPFLTFPYSWCLLSSQ